MAETWTHKSPSLTPRLVADIFVANLYPGRKIGAFIGQWQGLNYRGSFSLVGGAREYEMTGDHYGNYTITPN